MWGSVGVTYNLDLVRERLPTYINALPNGELCAVTSWLYSRYEAREIGEEEP
jgi:hypothetical protein